MRHQVVMLVAAASDEQISLFLPLLGILFVIGPLGKEMDKKPLPYVLKHGQETNFSILPLWTYHFYCGIAKGSLLGSCLSLASSPSL